MKRIKIYFKFLLVFLVFVCIINSNIVFGATDDEIRRTAEALKIAYRNYIEASKQGGPDNYEAQKWFNEYRMLAEKYAKLTKGSPTDLSNTVFNQENSNVNNNQAQQKPSIFKRIGYQFLERLKVLLTKVPSHVNDFALAETNFVMGNYKDALTLYQMAERKAELDGKYYYQAIYWQGRCYLEMAKNAKTISERNMYYKKAQERFLNVSMNLLLKKYRNNQEIMYEQDSTNLVIQLRNVIGLNVNNNPTNNNNQNNNTSNNNTNNNFSNFTSKLDDNSWKKSLRYDYLISDKEYINVNSMSRAEIQNFLKSKNSVLAYPINGKYPADMIYEAAHKYGISPKVLLARLQTEQGLVTKKTATRKELDWALGCGAYDGGNWNTKYKGLEKQIEYGAQTMRNHYNIALSMLSQKDSIPMKIDGQTIYVKNAATYAQYKYTPHKDGNKLFRSIYVSFFD